MIRDFFLVEEQSIDLNNIGTNGKILQTKTKEIYLQQNIPYCEYKKKKRYFTVNVKKNKKIISH